MFTLLCEYAALTNRELIGLKITCVCCALCNAMSAIESRQYTFLWHFPRNVASLSTLEHVNHVFFGWKVQNHEDFRLDLLSYIYSQYAAFIIVK